MEVRPAPCPRGTPSLPTSRPGGRLRTRGSTPLPQPVNLVKHFLPNTDLSNMGDQGAVSISQPLCEWAESSRRFAIHISPDVIGRLGTESWVAFKRVPRRGLEIGGVLIGHVDSQDDSTTFWIEGFAPVESEHRSG